MRAYQLPKGGAGIEALVKIERPDPKPAYRQVLLKVIACSLNFRDLGIVRGTYRMPVRDNIVPLSDGAGEVVEVGGGVTRVKVGDKVAGCFFQRWSGGEAPPDVMTNAFGCLCIIAANAPSYSSLVRIGTEINCRPNAGTAMISSSRKTRFESLSGFHWKAHPSQARHGLFQNLNPLADEFGSQNRGPGDISAWSSKVCHKSCSHGVTNANHDNWNCGCRLPRRSRRRRAIYDEDVHRQRGKFTRGLPQSIKIALRETVFDGDVAALDVAKIVEALPEVIPYRRVIRRVIDNANARNPYAPLLRARGERPGSRRAAQCGYQFTPSNMDCQPPTGVMQLEGTISHLDVLRCGIQPGLCRLRVKSSDPRSAQSPSLCLHHSRKLP